MDQTTLNFIFVGASFALYFGIAIWARAGSTSEFYAAGRGVNPVVNGMATAADWMSAASFISMAGLIAFTGYNNSLFLMGWTGGYVLMAMLLAPYLRKFGKYTVPEFVGDRYYSQTARVVAVVCLIVISTTYVIGQMAGAGVAFSRFLEVQSDTGLIIAACVVAVYAVLGGMKGITYTQVAQYCVLIIAYTIPAIFISLQLTGNPIPGLGLFSSMNEGLPGGVEAGVPLLTTLDGLLTDLGFNEYTATTNPWLMALYTLSLMIGTAGLPHVIIRFFTVPRVADARWSAGWALVFIALLYLTAPAVGAMARLNVITTMWPNGVEGEAVAVDDLPDWFRTWEVTGLLGVEDLNGDGMIQYYNAGSEAGAALAEAQGLEGNELVTFNRDILVLANPEIAQLPGWVIGLIAAGGLAAALSTAAGLLLAISSAISHDLIKSTINPNISEKGELMAARVSMLVAIVIATYLGLNPPGFAAQVVALAFGLAAASLFPTLMMGIFSKRINSKGAVAGMLAGLISTCLYLFLYLGWFFIPGTAMLDSSQYLFGIPPTHFGPIGALFNFAVAYLVSNATEEVPQEIQELVESVRIPRGAGAAVDH
ncbi:sodium:solute symporter family protein [Nioella sediminis]|jgi:cation/acetate symporter|uniref:sodium:solute symporter family protein n=1 Tax=Nioella sediminis TaxID=1912092 RepID=UPI0008FD5039|nr:sodium:solute symporter family protein [Nioella sediminis]TBX28708.1 sodium:solute symporter [Roseovarius sp. JS7-11]